MNLKVNGEVKKFETPLTLLELLGKLSVTPEKVVVEHNLNIVPRQDLGKVTL